MNHHLKPRFVRFTELRWADIDCDMHLHTCQSDGEATPAEMMAYAVERKLDRIAFTEHVRRDTQWFDEFARAVRAAREQFASLEALVGCEAKALDTQGTLDTTEEIRAVCDIVLGSVHRFPNGRGGYLVGETLSPERFARIEFDLAMGLLAHAPIDVLAHPGGMYARRHGEFPHHLMREILVASLRRGIAVEINTSYLRDLPAFLKLCAEVNPYVSIGSDAHRLVQVGTCRDRLLDGGVGAHDEPQALCRKLRLPARECARHREKAQRTRTNQ